MAKIIAIYDFLKELGGLERVMFFQANKLKKNHDIGLVFPFVSEKDKLRIIEELELDKSIKIKQIGRVPNEVMQLVLSFLFPSRIKKYEADMVIAHSFMASRMAYYKKKNKGVPYIVVIYHPPNFIYSNIDGWVNNVPRFFAKMLGKIAGKRIKKIDYDVVKNADEVITISKYSSKRIKEIYGVSPVIVYPQISSFFRIMSQNEREEFLKRKKIRKNFLLAHGRIIPDKNYSDLLDILKKVKDIDLIISGGISDKYKRELERKIEKNELKSRVKIMDRISKDDLLGYYNCAKLFLLPAKKEDFGLTPVEAMTCGCPVIAWDDGAGPSETVKNNINGLLAKPYDIEDFSIKIKEALGGKWNRQKIASSVRKFSEEEVGKDFLKIIDKVLKKS